MEYICAFVTTILAKAFREVIWYGINVVIFVKSDFKVCITIIDFVNKGLRYKYLNFKCFELNYGIYILFFIVKCVRMSFKENILIKLL